MSKNWQESNIELSMVRVKDYLKRLDKKIKWYDSKRKANKWYYISSKLIGLIASALIPLIIAFNFDDVINKIITASLGFLCTIAAGSLSLLKFHENWIEYSKTASSLRREKWMFLTRCGIYTSDDSFQKFAYRVESIISKQNSAWVDYISEKQGNDSQSTGVTIEHPVVTPKNDENP